MSLQATIDFRLKTLADPASPPSGWALGTGSLASRYNSRGEVGWEATSNQALWYNTTVMQGNVIESEVTAGLLVSGSIGAAIVDINGNGYMAINNDTASSLRLFLVVASQLSGSALVTVNLPMVTGQRIMLRRTISPNNNYEILINGVSQGSYNAPATYDPKYGACVSRYGSVRQVDLYYTPNQTVTSINSGNPITANQTTVSSVTTGFTDLPTSITCDLAGITCSSIGGTTNAPTFVKSQRVNGSPWPLNGSTATFTYVNGSESASGTQVIQKEAGDVVYTFSGVITDDPASIGYWLTQDGFTVEGGEHSYTPYGDLVLTADGGGTVTNSGTFTSWFRPATGTGAGNVYAYTWVINEAGEIVDTNPDAGSFGTVTGATPSAVTELPDVVTILGVTADTDCSAVPTAGTEYQVSTDGGTVYGAWTSATTNVRLNYKLRARKAASASTSTAVTATVTVGTTVFTGTITTRAGINIPNQLVFTSYLNSEVATEHTSSTQTITGMDTGETSAFTVANGTYSKNGGSFISTAGTLQNGDTFALRGTSDTYYGRTKNVTLTATNGSVVSTYKIVNKLDPLLPNLGGSTTQISGRKITGRKI